MHIALSFNLKGDAAGSMEEPTGPPSDSAGSQADDRFAEWDDIHTIKAVEAALASQHQVTLVEADLDAFETYRTLRPELVFNIAEGLHGVSREGQIPAMLDMLGIPYTGSAPLTLGLCLDKGRTKEILSQHGISTPRFAIVKSPDQPLDGLRFPLIVKPTLEGSSKGVTDKALVQTEAELAAQLQWVISNYRQPALVEEFLPGREFTVAMLGNGKHLTVLPIVEINFDTLPAGVQPIYSYEAKWLWDREEDPLQIFSCPAVIEPLLRLQIEELCKAAFTALDCRDWCRIDVRLDPQGLPHVIELNPLPGILPRVEQNSCFPKAARAAGLSYEEMILAVVEAARARLALPAEGSDARRSML